MTSLKFLTIPTPMHWRSASSVMFAVRKNDIVLDRIDKLLAWLSDEADAHQQLIQKCDLFFTADYWLKNYKQNPLMDKERAAAVQALFERVALTLCADFTNLGPGTCDLSTLPKFLEMYWGRPLSDCGVTQDHVRGWADYITRAEAQKYRIWFKNGLAYEKGDKGRILLNSSKYYDQKAMAQVNVEARDYGFFVLTMSRDLYMAKHRAKSDLQNAFYHSSYVAGSPVQCSGTMRIRNGKIERIRLNSGHYKPNENNMRGLLMALRMWGVAVETIVYEKFSGQPIGDGSYKAVLAATNDPVKFAEYVNRFASDKEAGDRLIRPRAPAPTANLTGAPASDGVFYNLEADAPSSYNIRVDAN